MCLRAAISTLGNSNPRFWHGCSIVIVFNAHDVIFVEPPERDFRYHAFAVKCGHSVPACLGIEIVPLSVRMTVLPSSSTIAVALTTFQNSDHLLWYCRLSRECALTKISITVQGLFSCNFSNLPHGLLSE
jgi:hypothetical protein